MQTTVSAKGQVVLPGPLRRKLGIREGDPLDISVEEGRIVLAPRKKEYEAKIIADPTTGLPVLMVGDGTEPVLTNEEIAEMLIDFP